MIITGLESQGGGSDLVIPINYELMYLVILPKFKVLLHIGTSQ